MVFGLKLKLSRKQGDWQPRVNYFLAKRLFFSLDVSSLSISSLGLVHKKLYKKQKNSEMVSGKAKALMTLLKFEVYPFKHSDFGYQINHTEWVQCKT